jgi:hypothetical protein
MVYKDIRTCKVYMNFVYKVHVYKDIRINGFTGLAIYSGRQPLLQTDVLTLLSDV